MGSRALDLFNLNIVALCQTIMEFDNEIECILKDDVVVWLQI